MPAYAYKTIDSSGAVKEKKIEADSEHEARIDLMRRGIQIISFREVSNKENAIVFKRKKKPSADEMGTIFRQLSILIKAGVPIVDGLYGLSEQSESAVLKKTINEVAQDVSYGSSLSESLEKHQDVFPNLAVQMAKVAEAGGTLADTMARLADHIETNAEISRKVKSALSYPMVIVIISIITVLVMVTFILPRFMQLFERMEAKLPWTTKALMDFSNNIISYWYLYILGIIGLIFTFKKYSSSAVGKKRIDGLLLKLPVVGVIIKKVVLSRVLASMATLLSCGVPMVQTLQTAASAANNEIVKEALIKTSVDVSEGSSTSQSLKETGVFPPIVIQMVESGEKTGELPSMLEYIRCMFSRETDAKIKSITSVIEPIMIVILGLIVGFIAISIIVPIYSLVGGVK